MKSKAETMRTKEVDMKKISKAAIAKATTPDAAKKAAADAKKAVEEATIANTEAKNAKIEADLAAKMHREALKEAHSAGEETDHLEKLDEGTEANTKELE